MDGRREDGLDGPTLSAKGEGEGRDRCGDDGDEGKENGEAAKAAVQEDEEEEEEEDNEDDEDDDEELSSVSTLLWSVLRVGNFIVPDTFWTILVSPGRKVLLPGLGRSGGMGWLEAGLRPPPSPS